VEERIIEYERKLPFKGFASRHLFPNEPQFKRGDGSGLALLSKEDLLLPAGWTWLDGVGVRGQMPLAQNAICGCMPSTGPGTMGAGEERQCESA
jgi:hypothetical protein